MKQLEKRFYPREEIAAIAGLDIHGHNFSTQIRRCLEKWGYDYQFLPRKGFEIIRVPELPEEKLVELLRRVFHLDSQIDPYAFSCFISAFSLIENFDSMPWDTREMLFYEYFEISISSRTMMNWLNCISDGKTIMRDKKVTLWHTYTKNGRKVQELADRKSPEYKAYCKERSELLERLKKDANIPKRERWGQMVKMLYKEYGTYYPCDAIVFNAFGTEVNAICNLTYEIMIQTD